MKKFNRNTAKLRESWILCFILGIVMLNYPFLHIFNKPEPVFGIPILILYFFVGWPISIGVIYLFSKVLDYLEPVGTEENIEGEKDPR